MASGIVAISANMKLADCLFETAKASIALLNSCSEMAIRKLLKTRGGWRTEI